MANLTCIALNCTSSSRNNKVLRFHHIPSDEERRTEWIIACRRTDLMDKPPTFFKNKYVCCLHFPNYMYKNKNLQGFATPSFDWTATSRDSCTQTWESIKCLESTPDITELHAITDLKKIEVRASHTQTEEFIFCAKHYLDVKKEDDITSKSESKIKEDEKELTQEETDEDSEQKSEDEASETSIDEFLQLNEELENQIREELKKKNIPQTPIKKKTKSKVNLDWLWCHKGIQTDSVIIYKIPKNNKCFQQCLRCGKNASRLAPKQKKPDHLITLEDFETACEQFLTPEFCTTVKNQIQIESRLKKLGNKKNTKKKPIV